MHGVVRGSDSYTVKNPNMTLNSAQSALNINLQSALNPHPWIQQASDRVVQ